MKNKYAKTRQFFVKEKLLYKTNSKRFFRQSAGDVGVQGPESSVQPPESRIECPESSIQLLRPESMNSGMRIKNLIKYTPYIKPQPKIS